MAIKLQVSNSLTQLAISLCDNLKRENSSVFQPYFLVTQTDGMNNWLKLQMAQNLGIAANYKFLKPNDLIQKVYNLFIPWGNSKPLSADNQTWLLYKLLAENEFINRFKTIANYYNNVGHNSEIKRLALAQKIADLFDQYQIYRPQKIKEWNKASLTNLPTNNWQEYLWVKTQLLINTQLLDKTVLSDKIITALHDPQNQRKLKNNMPTIHLFGLSITTNYHLELFYKIGQYINIWFHIINPSPEVYWFDDKSEKQLAIFKNKSFKHDIQNQGNALLTNWGSIIKETFGLLFKNEELLNAYYNIGIEEPAKDSLLHKIQNDVYNSNITEERNILEIATVLDGSITINSCFTPVREVEVLYNYLVHLVDKNQNEKFSAREIVVMVSDIDAYAPYIKAVFSNAPYKFPFTIADESIASDDTLSGALKSILTLNSENFKAENVLQLLDHNYIKNRFGITNLTLIRHLVDQANIRFGIEGDIASESIFVSWQYGLKRIIYGICISGSEEYFGVEPSIYPLDAVEGANAFAVVNFCHFVKVLIDTIKQREKNRDLASWVLYVQNVLQNLVFEPNEEANEDYDLLIKQLAKYRELEGILTEQISYDVFAHNLLKNLDSTTRTSTFAAGGITFCSLIPMRSIPFKVVALLGLNFDKFPRKEKPISFSLMQKKEVGDRNVKENDKHLFLETLLSAQQYLYISYVGQSVKNNTSIPPSGLVDELLNYIQTACFNSQDVAKQLVTKHPLHSFSNKYSNPNFGLYNYLDDLKPNLTIYHLKTTEIQPLDFSSIDLDKMISFFQNPIKGYYNNVLNIYYQANNDLLPETELFELDRLQQWHFKNTLLWLDETQLNIEKNKWIKTGQLPLKNMASVNLQAVENEVKPVKKLVLDCVGNAQRQKQYLEIEINQSIIKTKLLDIYDDKLLTICWSKNENQYLLAAYIKYLAATSAGLNLRLIFISALNNKIFEWETIPQEVAIERLSQLFDLYKKGHQEIIVFYPKFKITPNEIETLDDKKFRDKVKDTLDNYNFTTTDAYLRQEYNDGFFNAPDALERYKQNASILLAPLHKYYE